MSRFIISLFIFFFLVEGGAQETPQVEAKKNDPKIEGSEENYKDKVSDIESFTAPYIYETSDRRDPFEQIISNILTDKSLVEFGPFFPLQKFELSQLELVGILWDVKKPRAMFKDPDKKLHIVGPDTRLGKNKGYIAVIREGEVVIVEPLKVKGEQSFITKILKLKR